MSKSKSIEISSSAATALATAISFLSRISETEESVVASWVREIELKSAWPDTNYETLRVSFWLLGDSNLGYRVWVHLKHVGTFNQDWVPLHGEGRTNQDRSAKFDIDQKNGELKITWGRNPFELH